MPLLAAKRPSIQEDISPVDTSMISARRTSRGGSFSHKEVKEMTDSLPVRKSSNRIPSGIKMEPISPTISPNIPSKKHQGNEIEISNSEVATFFKMVRQKKLTADEFIYMIQKEFNQNDHYNMQVVHTLRSSTKFLKTTTLLVAKESGDSFTPNPLSSSLSKNGSNRSRPSTRSVSTISAFCSGNGNASRNG